MLPPSDEATQSEDTSTAFTRLWPLSPDTAPVDQRTPGRKVLTSPRKTDIRHKHQVLGGI